MAASTAAVIRDEFVSTGQIAELMLLALAERDLPKLESGIEGVGAIRRRSNSGVEDEQMEILSAIAEDLKSRFHAPAAQAAGITDTEGVEVHVSLLRHLARRSFRAG